MKNDEVRKILIDLDSDKLREISKNKECLSDVLYVSSWPNILLTLGVPIHDAIKEIRMLVIFYQCVVNFGNMSDIDRAKLMDFYSGYKESVYDSPSNHILYLRDLVIGAKHLEDEDGKDSDWSDIKNKLNEVKWDSIDFKGKIIEPIEKFCEILYSFGYRKE